MSRSVAAGEFPRGDTSTPAVVLKFDQNVMHHGGLGVIRSLGRLGVPVYGVHEEPWAPAASSRYLSGRYYWRPSLADTGRVLAGLQLLARRIGSPAVLIPTDDAGSIFLAEHGGELRESFLFPDPPPACPGAWPASSRCTSSAASLACRARGPPCRSPWPRHGNSRPTAVTR